MSGMFTLVHKHLQIPTFFFYGCSACSLLFRYVVVKLSSAPDLHRPVQAIQQLSSSYLGLMYTNEGMLGRTTCDLPIRSHSYKTPADMEGQGEGILVFVPVVPLLVPAELGVIGPLEGFQLSLFAVNWLHSLTHLAIEAAGLALYRSPAGARSYALAIGVLYLVLFLVGLVLPNFFRLLPLGGWDLILHLVTALIAFGAYFTSPEAPGPARTRV
jgi:Domain of unknown function (DUF4383)